MTVGSLNSSDSLLREWGGPALILLGLIISVAAFYDGLAHMTLSWSTDEYSHASIIPFISLFLLIQRLPSIEGMQPKNRMASLWFIGAGLMLLALGEFSALNTLIQYGFIISLAGIFISILGINVAAKLWVPLVYLVFMIPLPTILQNNLSNELQLFSSNIGVFIVRLFGISVFLEGNVIDLGAIQLQVVDACSGLRYLFPLMSFGFLVAAVFKAPVWQKVLIFLSTIPIAVLMNSIRIGIIGVTVEYWGPGAAEGLLHDFEGWVVFMVCIATLLGEIMLISKLSGSKVSVFDRLDLALPNPVFNASLLKNTQKIGLPFVLAIVGVLVSFPLAYFQGQHKAPAPERLEFSHMPLYKNAWIGRESSLSEGVLSNLKLTDYFIADYKNPKFNVPVNYYVAYYQEQNKGAAIHSPKSCIPAGGWEISEFDPVELTSLHDLNQKPFFVNRAVVEKGESKSIVYYWFQQQGRVVTNELVNRWYVFWDSLVRGRSDGALVRVVARLPHGEDPSSVDAILEEFLREFYPTLEAHVPP